MQLIRLIVSVLRSFLLCILLLCTTACLALGLMRVMPVPALSAERTSQVAPRDTTAKASRHHKTKGKEQTPSAVHDTLSNGTPIAFQTDSTGRNITFALDSTATDSTRADSAHKKDGLDQPVAYEANDSSTYIADTRLTTLYGDSKVRYQDMTLSAARISMNNDSTLAHAYADRDSTGELIGKPVYTQNSDNYESEEMSYNFKTKKGFIKNVSTEQGQGFLNSQSSKRANDGTLFLQHAKYTTCDAEHPHFYLALSRAKVRPGKEAVFGPAYLVVEDVPLPLAIPGGFFPFTRKYSSGFIVPSYGSETSRGFYLRDGGYYFAINDRIDLTLLGELYTKGSWGLNASSTYKKRYKYSGSFYVNYLNTIEGEKNMPDYSKTTSFKIQWTHRQDPKASMFSQLSASVNFATQSFERSNLASLYNPTAYTQATRTSSVSYSRTIPSLGMTLSASTNLSQNMTDSTIALSLPELNISVSRFYPFRRKHQVGKQRWYEKIAMTYTGQLSNSITTKAMPMVHFNIFFSVFKIVSIVLAADGEFFQVVVRAVVDIEIDITLDARQSANVGVLPEFPLAFVFDLIDVVMGNPVGIIVENGRTEIGFLEFVIGVENGLHVVAVLDDVKPREHVALEILDGTIFRLEFDVEYGRQIAFFEFDLAQEIVCLVARRRFVAPKMVGTADKTVFASLVEIFVEALIDDGRAFGRFDDDEPKRTAFDHRVAQLVPLDFLLIVGDVDAVDFVAFGIAGVAVERTPAKSRRSNEKGVEQPDIDSGNADASNPPRPSRIAMER